MDPSHLEELIRLEESYWWHVAKRKLVTGILAGTCPAPARVVEGGIGSSRNLREFKRLGYDVTGFDLMARAVQYGRDRGLDDVHQHDLSQPWPLAAQSVDVVVLLDVLEHLPDPAQVLRHAAATLKIGGAVILTVPAYPWLYSRWDRSLGHFRRYSETALRADAEAAGLMVDWLTHWNAFSLPAAVVMRTVERFQSHDRSPDFPRVSPLTNRLLTGLASVERWWLRRGPVPCGLSFVGVLRNGSGARGTATRAA